MDNIQFILTISFQNTTFCLTSLVSDYNLSEAYFLHGPEMKVFFCLVDFLFLAKYLEIKRVKLGQNSLKMRVFRWCIRGFLFFHQWALLSLMVNWIKTLMDHHLTYTTIGNKISFIRWVIQIRVSLSYLSNEFAGLKTGDLLKKVQLIWNYLRQDKKRWPFNTVDCLIEVTAWAGLTTWNKYHGSDLVC
jgi:hypothetical protein